MSRPPAPPLPAAFGELITNQRHELGLPLRYVAATCGVYPNAVRHLERGRARSLPRPDFLEALADVLKIAPEELVAAALPTP